MAYNSRMPWLRKSAVYLLSLVLLVSLIGLAVSTGANITLSKPSKVEQMLEQSRLYDNFASYASEQSQKSLGLDAAPGTQPDTALKQAASSVFTPEFLKLQARKVIESNYAWLQGKTDKPDFAVDLTDAKQRFAQQAGGYVSDKVSALPACTPAQLAQLSQMAKIDWLNVSCRPPGISPAAAGALVEQRIASSDNFLDNSKINADTTRTDNGSQGNQPYYLELSGLPKLYQLGQKLPLIAVVLAILSTLGIVYAYSRRRDGLKRVSIVLLWAGVLLALTKFISDFIFNKLDRSLFNQASTGPLQRSLADFTHQIQRQLVTIDLYFALAYLTLGAGLWFWLRQVKHKAPVTASVPASEVANRPISTPHEADSTGSSQTEPSGPPPLKKKPKRLIQ